MATCVTPPPIASSSKNRADCRYNWIIHKNIFFLYLFYNSVQLYTGKLQKNGEASLSGYVHTGQIRCRTSAACYSSSIQMLHTKSAECSFTVCCKNAANLKVYLCIAADCFLQNLQLLILYTLTFFSISIIFTNLQQIPYNLLPRISVPRGSALRNCQPCVFLDIIEKENCAFSAALPISFSGYVHTASFLCIFRHVLRIAIRVFLV